MFTSKLLPCQRGALPFGEYPLLLNINYHSPDSPMFPPFENTLAHIGHCPGSQFVRGALCSMIFLWRGQVSRGLPGRSLFHGLVPFGSTLAGVCPFDICRWGCCWRGFGPANLISYCRGSSSLMRFVISSFTLPIFRDLPRAHPASAAFLDLMSAAPTPGISAPAAC